MSAPGEVFSRLLGPLYEAATSPAHWPEFFEALRQEIPTNKAFFLLADPDLRCSIHMSYGVDPYWQKLYDDQFCCHDVLFEGFMAASTENGEWIGTTRTVISDEAYHRSVLYNEFIVPQGQTHHCGALLAGLDGNIRGGISINRQGGDKLFSSQEIALLSALAPHLRRALNMHRVLSIERQRNAELQHTVDALDLALVSVSHACRVLSCTLAAQSILQTRDGLYSDRGQLRACVPAEQKRLQRLISGAVATGTGRGESQAIRRRVDTAPEAGSANLWTPSAGGAMLISRAPPRRALQVVVTPFYSSEILLAEHPAALVFINDPDASPSSRASILRTLFALSPAECRMVDLLCQGITLTHVAEKMKTTVGTARFRLKGIFHKTGFARQSDLIRMVGALPGMRRMPDPG